MKIAIDLDEVLADLLTEYIHFLHDVHDLSLSYSNFTGYYTWDKCTKTEREKAQFFKSFYQSAYFKKIIPVQDAVPTINKLRRNHELYIITSRPEYLQSDTKKWVHKYFPDMFHDIYYTDYLTAKKKSDICKILGTEIIIEDCMDYALDCANNEICVFLINHPWNKLCLVHKRIQRVKIISDIRL